MSRKKSKPRPGTSEYRWSPAQRAKFIATMKARRKVGRPRKERTEVTGPLVVMARRLEDAIHERVIDGGRIEEVEIRALALAAALKAQ